MKFGYVTDTHIMPSQIRSRADNYAQAVLAKLQEAYEIFRKNKVEFVIHGGDLFHRHKIFSYKVLKQVRHTFKANKFITYFIEGQHDLDDYNKESYEDSALEFMADIADDKFVLIENILELKHCILYASHCYDDPKTILDSIPKSDKPQIAIVHALLHDRNEMFDVIRTETLVPTNANLVLSGDLHCGFPMHEIQGTTFYNPGAMARTSSHCKDRNPQVAIIEVDDFFGQWKTSIVEYELPHNGNVFIEKKETPKTEGNLDKFVENFQSFRKMSSDIFQLVDLLGKQKGKEAELINYIMSFKKAAK